MNLIEITGRLSEKVSNLHFDPPVEYVYNPLSYAWDNHRLYLEKFGMGPKRVIFLGMNPGPFGMAQTGIPFGDIPTVRDWLRLDAHIGRPEICHPKRPIDGLECTRVEVSGSRLWGWVKKRWGSPENFFENHFVLNYCPLVFMEAGGKNRTPVLLPAGERNELEEICDQALRETVEYLQPEWILGVGNFARDRAKRLFSKTGIRIGRVLHPSPASPAANRGWAEQVEIQLREQCVYQDVEEF